MFSPSSMRLPFFMARRYLFSRKKVGAINIISIISILGVAFGTAALLCTLSVFNGFHDLVSSLYTSFDPPLLISPKQEKFIDESDYILKKIQQHPQVEFASYTLTDHALILFQGRPTVITLKGVDNDYQNVTRLDSILYGNGQFRLERGGLCFGTPGIGLAVQMGGIDFGTLQICAPRKGERVNLINPIESFSTLDITASGVCFNVNQKEYDESYLIVPLRFAQQLFEQPHKVTALELRLKPNANISRVKDQLQQIAGSHFKVENQMEQQQDVFNVMQIEKFIAYLFLTFILIISCFNIIGCISMLIIDKRNDVMTLCNLGATKQTIFRVFLYEGRFITIIGAFSGIILGLLLCWMQQTFGLIKLGGDSGNFIVRYYPVSIHVVDILIVFTTVIVVGFMSVWYPVKYLTQRFLNL